MKEDPTPVPAPSRAWLYLTGFALALAAWIPWFTFRELHQDTTFDISLFRDVTCSTFIAGAEPCRGKWLGGVGVAWELVPIFLVLRIVTVGVLALLLWAFLTRATSRARSWIALVSIVVFALFIASVPGDESYRDVEPTWGALLGVGGAISIFVQSALAPVETATRREKWAVFAGTLGAVLALAGSLWFPIASEPEALFPKVPAKQSAYSYGSIASRFHWQSQRFGREHYMERSLNDPEYRPERLFKHETLRFGAAVAASGVFVAVCALAFVRARDAGRSVRELVFGGVALLATAIAFFNHVASRPHRVTIPSTGAVAIAAALACFVWMFMMRRAKP